MRAVRENRLQAACICLLVGGGGCGGGDNALPAPALRQVPDSVARDVVSMLPDGALLARPVSRGDVGLGDSFVVVWSFEGQPGFAGGVIADGVLHPLPSLHDAPPVRIGAIMAVQADADAAGELVVLLDYTEARPERRMTPDQREFQAVVIDYGPKGLERVGALEQAVAGISRPNEIKAALNPAPRSL